MSAMVIYLVRRVLLLALLMPAFSYALPQAQNLPDNVSNHGVISVPLNFRTDFVFIGSWFLALKESDAKLVQHVYSRKEDVEAYQQAGVWPDGAMLIKEQLSVNTSDSEKLAENFAGPSKGLFVMVKDREQRFRDNPLWGDGWGWSFFSASDPVQTVTKDYQAECLGCHEPVRDSDLVFIKGYPILKKSY